MDSDWIKLRQEITGSAVFQDAELFRFWCWLLLNVNRKETQTQNGTVLLSGDIMIGTQRVANQLKISRSRTRRFIERLKELGRLATKSTTNGTILTVVDWETYGNAKSEAGHQNGHSTATPLEGLEPAKKAPAKKAFNLLSLEYPDEMNSPEVKAATKEWVEYKRDAGHRYKVPEKSVPKLLRQWAKIGGKEFCAAVETSIANGWRGLFEKGEGGGKTEKPKKVQRCPTIEDMKHYNTHSATGFVPGYIPEEQ